VLRKESDEFEKTLRSIPKRRFSGPEFLSWLGDEMGKLASINAKIRGCIEKELTASMGKPGVSGDAIKMQRAVDALFGHCRGYLAFELAICAADPPSKLKVFGLAFRGVSLSVVGFLEELTNEWSRAVEDIRKGSHQFRFEPTLRLFPQIKNASAEMEKLQKHPELYGIS
jgi:hypothetical protein